MAVRWITLPCLAFALRYPAPWSHGPRSQVVRWATIAEPDGLTGSKSREKAGSRKGVELTRPRHKSQGLGQASSIKWH